MIKRERKDSGLNLLRALKARPNMNRVKWEHQRRSEKQYTGQSDNYGEVLITNKLIKFYSVLSADLSISDSRYVLWISLCICHGVRALLGH